MNDITEVTLTHRTLGNRVFKVKSNEDNLFDVGKSFIRIGIIIPTRGDRPLFLENCKRMIEAQKFLGTALVCIVDNAPESDAKDITKRYRHGYDSLRGHLLDVIFLIEDDDFYAPDYFTTMLQAWESVGKPDLFGTRQTIYYHLKLRRYYTMFHEQRSSAMSTMIKPDLNFAWCPDTEVYTDNWLYSQLQYKLFKPDKIICLGIKHGVGKTGGEAHTTNLDAYYKMSTAADDENLAFMKQVMDVDSFEFYSNYFSAEQRIQFIAKNISPASQ